MGIQEEEKMPLVANAAAEAAEMARQHNIAVTMQGAPEAQWEGGLLQCCGKCDYNGFAACAMTKTCTPCTWGFNMKRAFGVSVWKHALIFGMLFSFWSYLYVGSLFKMNDVCLPHPHHHHHNEEHPHSQPLEIKPWMPGQGFQTDPQQQTFLAGATLDPVISSHIEEPVEEQATGFAVLVDGRPWDEVTATEDVNTQIQLAKNQAAEGMAQLNAGLGLGRKMLHKHDDDEDDDDKEEKKMKKMLKKAKKELKKHQEEEEEPLGPLEEDFPEGPEGKHHHGPKGPETPECRAAQQNVMILYAVVTISFIVGVVYVAKMRTRMRKQFGIKGSVCKDFWTTCCCLQCAICQETRTLAHNNVQDGQWYGPTVLARSVTLTAPVPQAAMKTPSVTELKA